jgi:enoyl-CoA hydratase/carnithine racemase
MSECVVTATHRDGVMVVRMASAPANALGAPIVQGLADAVDGFLDGDEKVLVITSGLPGVFAAGADIKFMATVTPVGLAGYRDALRAPLERLAASGRPSIAAIDGLALGGGLELAMACTLRFATPASQLGLPEVKLGLIPGAGGTQRLPRLVGRGRALEIMLSGRAVAAEEGHRIGLVDRLVDGDVIAAAVEFARELTAFPASAMQAVIACVDASHGDVADGMAFEGEEVVRMLADGEAAEGIEAFVGKRPPSFTTNGR